MPSEFEPTLFAFGDEAGFGQWLDGHYRQHLRYNAALAARSPPVIIANYPILTIDAGQKGLRFWLDAHESWHEQIRPYANVIGIDLSEVDFKNPDDFYQWLDVHNEEHSELDLAFGVA
jgi:hypothetical protein